MKKRVLSLLLAAVLALTALPGAAFAEEPENSPEVPDVSARAAETSGSCGENGGSNVRWVLSGDGTLTISGSGSMKDFGPPAGTSGTIETPPWRNDCVTVVIEEGVTSVGSFAFFNCPGLKRADIADSVESVGFKAFYLSRSLESADFGEGVKTIGEQAFCECRGLQAARLPNSLNSVERGAFQNCASLTEIIIPQNVDSVGAYTFYGCENLTKAALPEGLEVPDGALPAGVEVKTYTGETPADFDSIVENTGGDTGGSTGGDTGGSTGGDTGGNTGGDTGGSTGGDTGGNTGGDTGGSTGGDTGGSTGGDTGGSTGGDTGGSTGGDTGGSTGGDTGGNTGGSTGGDTGGDTPAPPAETVSSGLCGKTGTSVSYLLDSNGLLTIQGTGEMRDYTRYALPSWSRYNVKTLVIGEGVTSAGQYAFYNCAALESARLPESLTTIGAYAFYGCAALPSVDIPQAVTSLGYGAFQNCSGLKEARVPLRLKKSAQNAFSADCEVTYYGTTGGECGKNGNNVTWTLDGDGLLTIQGTGEMKDYRPYIAESPWSKEAVKAVVVREGVTKVGDLAFGDLTALESAELPEGLTAIGNNAFNGCTALTEITLPRSLERVAGTAFLHSGLTRARVYYKTVFGSSQFPTDASAFPGDCLVSLYGKELTPGTPLRASRTAPAGSDNIHAGSGVECSYLAAGEGGGFYRVDCYSRYNSGKRDYDVDLTMEEYGPGGKFYQGWDIPMELPRFGGFYAGSDGFYFVFGQNNTRESDSVEVLRVVKYSKDLERLGAARLMGGNTQYPFDAASCRMAEGNGLLYIHTGHQMYKSEDGYNHQACMTLAVDTSVMEFQYQFYDILNSSVGCVSHSFDQYVRTDGDRVVRLDLGDGYPRGAALFVNGPNLGGSPDYAVTMKWGGDGGDNNTGSRLGGLEVSGSAYLTALSSVDQTGGRQNNNRTYNVYLLATSKGNLKETRTVQVTHFSEGGPRGAGAPKLVKLSDDRFLLLWEEPERVDYSYGSYYSRYTGTVKYAFFDGEGNQLGGVQSMSGAMSDCQPEVIDGKAVWYVTEDGGKPVFYQIGSDGRAGSFTPSSGQKPTGGSVTLPGDIKDALADGTAVFAASYSGGRLTGVYQGTVKDGKAVFDRKPPAGRTLYFLDRNGRPLCPPFVK